MPAQWDASQLEVIQAPASARLLVDAGPGTGKTAVACRRVAALIDDHGVEPGNIWLVSFTRTAVAEIQQRIRDYLRHPDDCWNVKIATIDSHAWAIHAGFDARASLTGSYDENIARVIQLVGDHDGVFEYLESVQHLIVDEAQDIVGVRADLMLAILTRLMPTCGATILADEAQAIYGFSGDDADPLAGQHHLPGRIRERPDLRFTECLLSRVYRAATSGLRTLFTDVRERVLAGDTTGPGDRFEQISGLVRHLADGDYRVSEGLGRYVLDSTFFLFRRRVDALMFSSFQGLQPHRLRMSGLPVLIHPWLAAIFWDFTEHRVMRPEFSRLWDERAQGLTAMGEQDAWNLLIRTAGETANAVSMERLRSRLGRASPGGEFVRPDFGLGGPVIGTIHGCKGREAQSVVLFLPSGRSSAQDCHEEARVVFVGATRAKAELRVGTGYRFLKSRRLDGSGRAFVLPKRDGPKAQVEIGRAGDLDSEGVAGKNLFRHRADVEAAQTELLGRSSQLFEVRASVDHDLEHRYRLVTGARDATLGFLSSRVNGDLFGVASSVRDDVGWRTELRPPDRLSYLRAFGTCSLVLHPDSPEAALLHEPWATSGFVVAPAVQGFTMAYFQGFRRRH